MAQETPQETPKPTGSSSPETPPPETQTAEGPTLNLDDVGSAALDAINQIIEWLQTPSFLAQVTVVAICGLAARPITAMIKKRFLFLREKPTEGKLLKARAQAFDLKGFIYITMIIGLLSIGKIILSNLPSFDQDWLINIAQGLAVVYLVYSLIVRYVRHPLIQKIVIWIAVPVAVLNVFGWYDEAQAFLREDARLQIGEIAIPAWSVINVLIFGGILFWVGRVSNNKGKEAIRSQDSIDVATRELIAKIFEMMIFAILFILLMGIAGIPMGSLVVIGAPLVFGIGLGLQPIAANFVSGIILLLDRSLKIGDFIELPDGKQGYVEAMNMRSATIETTDGKDIMVPNVTFTNEAYENWTHKDPRQRYEVYFGVGYETDVDLLEDILIPAISKHPKVLQEPEQPDLELREFGEFSIKFAIEFWADGIDDGENKFTSDLNYIVWRTLKANGIKMPIPQREIRTLAAVT